MDQHRYESFLLKNARRINYFGGNYALYWYPELAQSTTFACYRVCEIEEFVEQAIKDGYLYPATAKLVKTDGVRLTRWGYDFTDKLINLKLSDFVGHKARGAEESGKDKLQRLLIKWAKDGKDFINLRRLNKHFPDYTIKSIRRFARELITDGVSSGWYWGDDADTLVRDGITTTTIEDEVRELLLRWAGKGKKEKAVNQILPYLPKYSTKEIREAIDGLIDNSRDIDWYWLDERKTVIVR